MAVQAIAGLFDDAARLVMRVMGRASGPGKAKVTHYEAFEGRFGRMTGMNALAKREQRLAGKGFSGAMFGRPMKGLGVGLSHLKGLGYFAGAASILGAATAERGHKESAAVSGIARTLAFAVGDVVGTTLGGPLAGLALGSITEKAGAAVENTVQFFHDFNAHIKHVNMGGNYTDSRVAYTMRQRAAQEMGSSVMNARTWLGKEAALMHQ